jgi:DNA-binding NtrC family response regulator
LRAIERREVRPIGAAHSVHVDVRIIAATNRDLKREVNRGTFRADLFFRLNIISINVPPLRERVDDIPLLANLFWRRATHDPDGACPPELLQALEGRRWPGNVRELCNKVEAAALLHRNDIFTPDRPPFVSYREARRDALDAFEKSYLEHLMRRAHGNIAQAARLASMDRVYLAKLLQRTGLHSSRAR